MLGREAGKLLQIVSMARILRRLRALSENAGALRCQECALRCQECTATAAHDSEGLVRRGSRLRVRVRCGKWGGPDCSVALLG